MLDEVLLNEDVLENSVLVRQDALLNEDVLGVNTVLVRHGALLALLVSVGQRQAKPLVLFGERIGRKCQQALLSPADTTNVLDLEPKGDYVQYGYNNRIYCHEVVRGGGKEGQDSAESPGTSGGWKWMTCPSGTAQVPRTDGHARL